MGRFSAVGRKVKGRFRVGDRARPKYGWTDAVVEILEDRGPIGHQGSYYYFVRVQRPGLKDISLDWPEDELLSLETAPPTDGIATLPFAESGGGITGRRNGA